MARPKADAPWVEKHVRKSGTIWVARWRGTDGKKLSYPIGPTKRMSKADAAAEAVKIHKRETCPAEETPITQRTEKWTLQRAIELYEKTTLTRKTINTQTNYRSRLKRWAKALGNMQVSAIRPMHIEETLMSMGLAPRSLPATLAPLAAVLEMAVDNDIITKNPAKRVELGRIPHEGATRLLAEEEFAAVMSVPGLEGLIVRVCSACGLRRGEVIALRRDDIADGFVRVDETETQGRVQGHTKGKRTRYAPVGPSLWRDLQAHMAMSPYQAPDAFVFHNPDGTHITRRTVNDTLMPTVREASGVADLTMRMCRHAYATYVDGDPADIQASLGHANLTTTLRHYREARKARMLEGAALLEARFTAAEGGQVQ